MASDAPATALHSSPDVAYPRSFFEDRDAEVLRSARVIVPAVLDVVRPASVVDVGCGAGAWLRVFGEHGIDDLQGLDGPWVDATLLHIPATQFAATDLTNVIALPRRFELAVCLEVAEHLPVEASSTLVNSLVGLADVVVFSAAIPYQGGTHHVNEQWPTYWVQKFADRGFVAIDCLRPVLWDRTDIAFCYAQNSFIAVRASALEAWPSLAAARRALPDPPRDLVHPKLFLQSTAYAKGPVELLHGTLGLMRDTLFGRRTVADTRRLAVAARWPVAPREHNPDR